MNLPFRLGRVSPFYVSSFDKGLFGKYDGEHDSFAAQS